LTESTPITRKAQANCVPTLDLIAGSPQQRQQFFLQRLEQAADGWRVPLELAPRAARRPVIELMEGLHQLTHGVLDPVSIAQRHQRVRQGAAHIVFTFTLRQACRKCLDESVGRLERFRIVRLHATPDRRPLRRRLACIRARRLELGDASQRLLLEDGGIMGDGRLT
jgi:hypothetical protein